MVDIQDGGLAIRTYYVRIANPPMLKASFLDIQTIVLFMSMLSL